jgi:hypothetical protein
MKRAIFILFQVLSAWPQVWGCAEDLFISKDLSLVATTPCSERNEVFLKIGPLNKEPTFIRRFPLEDGGSISTSKIPRWTPDSRFFVFIMEHSKPRWDTIAVWDRHDQEIHSLERVVGRIEGDFKIIGTDYIEFQRVGESETVRVKINGAGAAKSKQPNKALQAPAGAEVRGRK